jgi:tetratricopeptide (TPR) repeat protein
MKLSIPSSVAMCTLAFSAVLGGTVLGPSGASAHGVQRHSAALLRETALQKGRAYMQKGDYKNAEAQFKLAVKQAPKSLVAYEQLGLAALYYRDFPASFGAFKKAAAFKPRDKQLLYYAGTSGLYAGQYADARNYVDQLLNAYPAYVAGWHLRFLLDTNLLDRKGQLKDALSLLRLKPHDANALNDAGMAYANNSKAKIAYGYFTRAIAVDPHNWEYYKNRSIADGMNKNGSAEVSDLKRAIALCKDAGNRKAMQAALAKVQKAIKKQKHT